MISAPFFVRYLAGKSIFYFFILQTSTTSIENIKYKNQLSTLYLYYFNHYFRHKAL